MGNLIAIKQPLVNHNIRVKCSHDQIRSDLTRKLVEQHRQFTVNDIDLVVKCILDFMNISLSRGGRVEIRGFGSFGLHYRLSRKEHNPKTGNPVNVPAKYVSDFKMGKELRERVDKP